jgi:predicted transcriptional regulator
MEQRRITIIKIRRPVRSNINEKLQWFGTSLGLFSLRDKDRSCFRIFIELLKQAKKDEPISSDGLAVRLQLSRGTVVHHLHKLMDSGIVVQEKKGYILRVHNLSRLIDELEKDMHRTFDSLKEIAEDIDKKIGG